MNLPIRALYEIRGFSRPASRPDWRTCKKREAGIIRDYERAKMPLQLVAVNYIPIHGCWGPVPEFEFDMPVLYAVRERGGGGC
jgi:hypothetical protein